MLCDGETFSDFLIQLRKNKSSKTIFFNLLICIVYNYVKTYNLEIKKNGFLSWI